MKNAYFHGIYKKYSLLVKQKVFSWLINIVKIHIIFSLNILHNLKL